MLLGFLREIIFSAFANQLAPENTVKMTGIFTDGKADNGMYIEFEYGGLNLQRAVEDNDDRILKYSLGEILHAVVNGPGKVCQALNSDSAAVVQMDFKLANCLIQEKREGGLRVMLIDYDASYAISDDDIILYSTLSIATDLRKTRFQYEVIGAGKDDVTVKRILDLIRSRPWIIDMHARIINILELLLKLSKW